ncbi:MAG: toll/interleukin-1 receptor domain-containing protein [Rhodospirillales bacterium]
MSDIVLSYSEADRETADRLGDKLRAVGFSVAPRNGDGAAAQVPCVVLWSARLAADPDASPQALRQALAAWADDRLVLAVLDETPLPAGLRDLSAIDLSSTETGIERVVARVRALAGLRAHAADGPSLAAPSPGRRSPTGKGSHRLFAVLGVIAILIGLGLGFFDLPRPASSPAPAPSRSEVSGGGVIPDPFPVETVGANVWSSGLRAWGFVGAGAFLLAIGLIVALRARRIARTVAQPVPRPASPGEPSVATPEPHQIFISYSRRDIAPVDRIIEHMEGVGYSVWIDREATGVATQRYAAPIVRAIRSAQVVALMCSRNAFASDHVVREVYVAGDFHKPFLAFQLDETTFPDELIYFLSGFPRIPADPLEPEQLREEIKRYVP